MRADESIDARDPACPPVLRRARILDLLDELHDEEAKARPTPLRPASDRAVVDVIDPRL